MEELNRMIFEELLTIMKILSTQIRGSHEEKGKSERGAYNDSFGSSGANQMTVLSESSSRNGNDNSEG